MEGKTDLRKRPRPQHDYRTVRVTRLVYEALAEAAKAAGTIPAKIIKKLVEGEQVQAAPTQIITTDHTHDDCARALLNLLEPTKCELAMEVCSDILGIRPWQLVVGHLNRVADQGEIQAPLLDARWDRSSEALPMTMTCEFCQGAFHPTRRGERYCSPSCGGKAATLVLRQAEDTRRPRSRGMVDLVGPGVVLG